MSFASMPSAAAIENASLIFDLTIVDQAPNWANEVPSHFERLESPTKPILRRQNEDSERASVEPTPAMTDPYADTVPPSGPLIAAKAPPSRPPAIAIDDEPSSNVALSLGYDDFDGTEEPTLGAIDAITAPARKAHKAPLVPDDFAERTVEDEAIVEEAIGIHQRYLFTACIAFLGLIAGVTTALLAS